MCVCVGLCKGTIVILDWCKIYFCIKSVFEFTNLKTKTSFIYKSNNYVLTKPTAWAGCDTRSILSRVQQVWSQSFPSRLVVIPRSKSSVCPPLYPWLEGGIIGFIPFPKVLTVCEMQTASSRVWTQAAVSISHDYNVYTTSTSKSSSYVWLHYIILLLLLLSLVSVYQQVPLLYIDPRLSRQSRDEPV